MSHLEKSVSKWPCSMSILRPKAALKSINYRQRVEVTGQGPITNSHPIQGVTPAHPCPTPLPAFSCWIALLLAATKRCHGRRLSLFPLAPHVPMRSDCQRRVCPALKCPTGLTYIRLFPKGSSEEDTDPLPALQVARRCRVGSCVSASNCPMGRSYIRFVPKGLERQKKFIRVNRRTAPCGGFVSILCIRLLLSALFSPMGRTYISVTLN